VVLASVSLPGKPGLPDREKLARLQARLGEGSGAWLAGWETLGGALSALVRKDLNQQLLPIVGLIAFTLLMTFRHWVDLLLSALLLVSGLGALAATMSLFGLSWNLASLAAIPLLLGTGIDYGIHILLALRRSGNEVRFVQSTTGRAVFFSGMTTVIGFSSLFFAGNKGISSLAVIINQFEGFFAHAAEAIGRRSGFERPTAKHVCAGFFDGMGDGHNLRLGFDGTGTGHDDRRATAHHHTTDVDNGVARVEFTGGQFVRARDTDDFAHARHALEHLLQLRWNGGTDDADDVL
jgi:hypothetical protein